MESKLIPIFMDLFIFYQYLALVYMGYSLATTNESLYSPLFILTMVVFIVIIGVILFYIYNKEVLHPDSVFRT